VVVRTCCGCAPTATAATTAVQPIGEQPIVCCDCGRGRRIPSVDYHDRRRRRRRYRRRRRPAAAGVAVCGPRRRRSTTTFRPRRRSWASAAGAWPRAHAPASSAVTRPSSAR